MFSKISSLTLFVSAIFLHLSNLKSVESLGQVKYRTRSHVKSEDVKTFYFRQPVSVN